jgi:flagellar hook-length control protein FliK
MLSAILPNAPSAAARSGKASVPTSEGVFQSVLSRESGKTDTSGSTDLAEQIEEKTGKPNATDIYPATEQQADTAAQDILRQEEQATLMAAQGLMPEVPFQAQVLEKAQGSGQTVAPEEENVDEQTALPMVNDPSNMGTSLETSPANGAKQQPAGQTPHVQTTTRPVDQRPVEETPRTKTVASPADQQPAAKTPGVQTAAGRAGQEPSVEVVENQPVNETLQSSQTVPDLTKNSFPQGSMESPSSDALKTVAAHTDRQAELPLPSTEQTALPVSSGKNLTAAMQRTTEPTVQTATGIGSRNEQTSATMPEIVAPMEEQISRATQPIAQAQSAQAVVVPSALPASGTTPRKIKSESLGDSRFTQLLGRSDASISVPLAAEPSATRAAGLEGTGLGLHTITGLNPADRTGTLANSLPTGENAPYPALAKGTGTIQAAVIQPEKVTPPAPDIALFTGAETSSPQPAVPTSQPGASAIDGILGGSNETAAGLPADHGQPALAASVLTPAFPPAQAQAAHGATLQQSTGFPIPEQEVMEQVIQRSSLHELEGKRELTVELHPEDLGQVKLNLVQEKDRMQLHLQAQNSEVRDILEKHLPRLQEALQQQGLRLEIIQVSVDPQRNHAQGFFERQQQHQAQRHPWQHTSRSSLQSDEQQLPVQAHMSSSARGLSLRI